MFGKMKDLMAQMKVVQEMMKDEQIRAMVNHPKMRDLLMDPEFQECLKSQDMVRIAAHPKMSEVQRDPELREMMQRVDKAKFAKLFGGLSQK